LAAAWYQINGVAAAPRADSVSTEIRVQASRRSIARVEVSRSAGRELTRGTASTRFGGHLEREGHGKHEHASRSSPSPDAAAISLKVRSIAVIRLRCVRSPSGYTQPEFWLILFL